MELWLGPGADNPVFADDEARRAAWLRHRDKLIRQLPSSPGRRPLAWWPFEAPTRWPGYDRERSTLHKLGALDEAEKAALETEWRADFDRAQAPSFMLCTGPGEFLHGATARKIVYVWADIPRELVRKWTAERRRATTAIRKLVKNVAEGKAAG
jgi:hypothetical protein